VFEVLRRGVRIRLKRQFNPVFRSANLLIAPLAFLFVESRRVAPPNYNSMLIIRKADIQDCPSIAQVHTSAVRAISDSRYTPEEIESWSAPRSADEYKKAIHTKQFYVAVENEMIVGFGVLNQENREIEAVYVSPDVMRRGVGLLILGFLEKQARALGLEELSLNASMNAVPFYLRAGYVPEKESKYRLRSGVEISCVPMAKRLVHRRTQSDV
jgi:putative acetyltransferase